MEILTPISYKRVRNAKKPAQTESYFPISHSELIDYIRAKIKRKGLEIVNESYSTNKGAKQMFGFVSFGEEKSGLRMALAFRNSHDKSLPVGFIAGAQIIASSHLILSGDMKQVRKHTSNMGRDLDEKFLSIQETLEPIFSKISKDAKSYRNKPLSYNKSAEIFGKVLMRETQVASTNQTTKAIELLEKYGSENNTVWDLFCAFAESLQSSHPMFAPSNHLGLTKFINEEFSI